MANYVQPKKFEGTQIAISDWITNTKTLEIFNKKDFVLGYYTETFRGTTTFFYKIVKREYISDGSFKFVSELPDKNNKKVIYNIIANHYENTQQGENNMNTVTIFGKQFRNAADALIAVLEDLSNNTDHIAELDRTVFPGLETAYKHYVKQGLTDDVTKYLVKIILETETNQLTDDLITQTAWELADHSETFEVNSHTLEIRS